MIPTQELGAFASLQIALILMVAALLLDLRRASRRQRLVRNFASALQDCSEEDYRASCRIDRQLERPAA